MTATADRIDVSALSCPGCQQSVTGEPPTGWPDRAGRPPEFSHRDGSVLCPDDRGRVPEPVEVRR